jgi:parvulin-like peptidyl-prolyl isomerase
MTFRARSAPKPTRRRVRRSDTRRAIYITIVFSLAIVLAVSLMGGVFLASYYSDHGAPIAAVNGQVISKDNVRDRVNLNLARYQRQLADFQTLRNQDLITTDEYSTLESAVTTKESSSTIYSDALTQLETEMELEQWAAKNGVSVTDAQVNAQIQSDATTPEMRHVKIISVGTRATPPASAVTWADSLAAQKQEEAYLAEVESGKAWDDVDKESAPYAATTSGTTGDLGLTSKASLSVDPDLADAIFALQKPGDITPIFKGSDGNYRFATITSIVPPSVDGAWETSVSATTSDAVYRTAARGEAISKAVQAAVEAKYITSPTVQRHVLELGVSQGYGQPGGGDEVKLKMLVFAPNHSASNAANIPTTDPTWTDALNRAKAAVAELRQDPSKWASIATDTTQNDDQYFASSAGEVPWIDADLFNAQTTAGGTGLGMLAVEGAVFQNTSLTPGTILDPILEPSQGYVVVMFQGRRPSPEDRIATAQFDINNGMSFNDAVRTFSETSDAYQGGDMGWVSPYMLSADQQRVIFETPVGSVSNMVTISGAYVIFDVVAEETRTPPASQQALLKQVVFTRWETELQGNSLVWQDSAALTAMNPSAT